MNEATGAHQLSPGAHAHVWCNLNVPHSHDDKQHTEKRTSLSMHDEKGEHHA